MNDTRTPSWWQRHWKGLLAAGCGASLALLAAAVVGVYALAMTALRSSEPYRHAMRIARSNPAVLIALGEPVQAGWWASGHFAFAADGTGEVQFTIPVHGSRGDGLLRIRGDRRDGVWHYDVLSIRVDTSGRRINLLGAPAPWLQPACRTASAASCNTISV